MIKSFKDQETAKIFRGQFSRKLPQDTLFATRSLEKGVGISYTLVGNPLQARASRPPYERAEGLHSHHRQGMQTLSLSPEKECSMTTGTTTTAVCETLADVLEHLGGIHPSRIRFRPVPGTATETDVLVGHDHTGRLYELVDGMLVEKAMGLRESYLASVLIALLWNFVTPRHLGIVTGEAGMMRLAAGLVRIPDVAFISWARLPNRQIPSEPLPALVPDLVVEVLSASNTAGEMTRKRQEYFLAGVEIVWQIDPQRRTVEVFTAPEQSTVLHAAQTLDGGTVLPGFTLSLQTLFAALDLQGED